MYIALDTQLKLCCFLRRYRSPYVSLVQALNDFVTTHCLLAGDTQATNVARTQGFSGREVIVFITLRTVRLPVALLRSSPGLFASGVFDL